MKKTVCLTLALFAMIIAACPGGNEPVPGGGGNKITIMFNTDGGSAVASVEIEEGGVLPPEYFGAGNKVPAKSDYKFIGWKDGGAEITAATKFNKTTTLTAQWRQLSDITITFNTDGGNAVDSITIKEESALPADYFGAGSKVPARSGYRFNGWKNGAANVSATTKFNQNTTLTAQWVLQITVSFSLGEDDDGPVSGTPPESVVIDNNTNLGNNYPEDPKHYGWDFSGWYNGSVKYDRNKAINVTGASPAFALTAQWVEGYIPEDAATPAIHPGNHFQETGGTTRDVKVNADFSVSGLFSNVEPGAGVISSKWYRATSQEDADAQNGAEIIVQTATVETPYRMSLPFTWREAAAGTYWYWVVVTNYDENASVNKYATATTQNKLKVTVTE